MIMFQASTILRNTRLDKDLTLDEVAKKTKIPKKYIQALEEGDKKNYPSEPYCSLFVRDYAQSLGLNCNEILSIFRRDYYQKAKSQIKNRFEIGFTPQFTFSVGVILVIIIFSTYLINEYIKFNQPPQLNVNWPETGLVLGADIELTGVTDPESTVRINQDLVVVDDKGKFTKKINLKESGTKISIESKSPSGKTTVSEKTIKVN